MRAQAFYNKAVNCHPLLIHLVAIQMELILGLIKFPIIALSKVVGLVMVRKYYMTTTRQSLVLKLVWEMQLGPVVTQLGPLGLILVLVKTPLAAGLVMDKMKLLVASPMPVDWEPKPELATGIPTLQVPLLMITGETGVPVRRVALV